MPVRCLKYISTARLVGQRDACRRNAGIAGDVVPAAAHCLGEGAKAERTARVQRYVVAVFVVMPQDPHLGGGLCRVWWAVDGGVSAVSRAWARVARSSWRVLRSSSWPQTASAAVRTRSSISSAEKNLLIPIKVT